MTPMRDLPLILMLMNLEIILDDSYHPLTPCPTIRANQYVINNDTPDFEKLRPYFGWVNVDTVQKTMEQSMQWESPYPILPYEKSP